MRGVAWILTLCALGLAGQAGYQLWLDLQQEPAEVVAIAAAPSGVQPQAPSEPSIARNWPPLFGEPQPPKPPEPPAPVAPAPEPQPPRPPKPPLDSLGYSLKGMVQAGDATWAMISHPTGEQLVRAGDTLADGIEIARIDEDGVWVSRQGDEPELLAFAE